MRHSLWQLLLAASFSMPASAQQDPGVRLTLAMALDLATKGNPDIGVAADELRAQDGAVRQAGLFPNPSLSAEVEDTRRQTRTTTVQLNQLIELGGKRAMRLAAAGRNQEAAQADLAIKRADIRAATVIAFYDVLAGQERQNIAQASLDLAEGATRAAAKRVAAGKVSPVEETKARIAESDARIELVQSGTALAGARRQLAALWGRAPDFVSAAGQFDALPALPPLDALVRELPKSPVLLRARQEVARRQALAQLESARQAPDLTVSAGSKRDEQLGRNQAVLGLSVPIPLFDRNQGNLHEALVRTDTARDLLAATEIRIHGELAQAHARLDAARREAALVSTDILPGAQSAHAAAVTGFEFGKFSFLEVLDAQRTLLLARSQQLRTLNEAHRAAADIERILGAAWTDGSTPPAAVKP